MYYFSVLGGLKHDLCSCFWPVVSDVALFSEVVHGFVSRPTVKLSTVQFGGIPHSPLCSHMPVHSSLKPWRRWIQQPHSLIALVLLELVSQSEVLLWRVSQDLQCKNLLANAEGWQGKANRDVGWKEPGHSNAVALAWPNWHMSWFPAQKRDQGSEPTLFLFLWHLLTAQFRPLNYLFFPVYDKWCNGHVMFSTPGSWYCLAHARSHSTWLLWGVTLVTGSLRSPSG